MLKKFISVLLLTALPLGAANAVIVTMKFLATDFIAETGGVPGTYPVPTDPINGIFVWEAASVHSTIGSLISAGLTPIDGHDYTLGEIGFLSPVSSVEPTIDPNLDAIGGLLIDPVGVQPGTNDFSIGWYRDTLTPFMFVYSSENYNVPVFISQTFPEFSVTAVPIPAALPLMLSGFAVLGLTGRRRKFV